MMESSQATLTEPAPAPAAAVAAPAPLFVDQLAGWAERTPDAVAVVFGDQHLSYAELARRAAGLARRLHRLGLRPEARVALCLERTPEAVIAFCGALAAGGVYLPLDPAQPRQRLAFVLADAAVAAVVTDGRFAADLPEHPAARLLVAEALADGDGAPAAGGALAGAGIEPARLAYAIYTSGSTGQPKGVMLHHAGLANLTVAHRRTFRTGPGAQVLQFSPLTFDASVHEIVLALAQGATLHLARRAELMPGADLLALLQERRITHLTIPPSALAVVTPTRLPHLELIACAGEACPVALVERWSTGRRFLNAYGPSESTVWTTGAFCAPPHKPSIGKPNPGFAVAVVDPDLLPVADGDPGELCIAGVGLARGYLRRPGLTAERFVPDSFGGHPGGRLYRTGDRVRCLPGGDLDFLDRIDRQTKVRGFRVELGEIEARLNRHPAVVKSVLLAREDVPGDRRLVAYVKADGPAPAPAELRAFLAEGLPEYMLPSAFVFLDAFPRTPNGKVDGRALPRPVYDRADHAAPFLAPRNEVETVLAGILGDLLGVERIGVHDELIELGAHSLVLSRLTTRLRQTLRVELTLGEVFDSPTIAALAARLTAGGRSRPVVIEPPPIRRAPRDRNLPLAFAQERIWFIEQLAPDNRAYNVQATFDLRGPLDAGLLAASFSEIVRRHEVLRTTFPASNGRPVQLIHPPYAVQVPLCDLTRLPAARRAAAAERAIAPLLRLPFDVQRLPLARWTLFRFGAEEHLLLHQEHHFVHDGWSFGLLIDELVRIYTARAAGTEPELPELPIQYADFAVWQREWLQGDALAHQLAYWKEQLADAPPVLALPTDRPRPKSHRFRGDAFFPVLPDALYQELRRFSQRQGVSLFMTTLSAFNALLYRWSGQDTVLVGTGIANRRLREVENLIGMVVNTVVIRSELGGDPTFEQLLGETRKRMLAAQIYQDVPFEQLVAELRLERHLALNPLYQVMFAFHDAPVPDLDFAGLTARIRYRHGGAAKTDLYVVGIPRAEQRVGLEGGATEEMQFFWEYNSDLFDRTTMARLWRQYVRVLGAAVADPGSTLRQLPLLDAGERHQLLWEWNDTERPFDRRRRIAEPIAAQAARRPDAVALVADSQAWSFAWLDARANRLAHQLRALGVGPGTPVGVALERSPEAVAALLAVLKAGGAYIPLEPDLPAGRVQWILERLAVRHLLTAPPVLAAYGGLAGAACLAHVVGFGWHHSSVLTDGRRCWGADALAAQPATEPPPVGDAEDLAYVIFTSGSTGVPKGVAVRHRPVANLADWLARDFGVGPDDCVLQLASLSFDLSVYDLFGLLAAGGSVRLVGRGDGRDPERLLAILCRERITFWDSAPAALQQLAPFLPATPVPAHALRLVFLSGDWIPLALPERVRRTFPGARVIALGGATEATVWSNSFPVGDLDPDWVSVPYGRPMPNAQYRVLDPRLVPAPVGVPGDLYIGGECLASGYAAAPIQTASSFLPDPFGQRGGERLYRTGDLARHLADGNLEFLGRRDQQVKVRGFRVELGEIEVVLARHPAVSEAVVVLSDGGVEERQIWAYAVPREPEAGLPVADLTAWLASRLPEYMVPAAFVAIAAIPLTANGKLDRKALPRPGRDSLGLAAVAAPPRNDVEARLVELWRGLLGGATVGVFDDFFDLGGHSLLATQLVSRLRQAFGVEIELRALFEHRTVAAQAEHLASLAGDRPALPPLLPRDRSAEAPLSFAQQRLWFLDQLDPGLAVYNVPLTLRLGGRLAAGALRHTLDEVVRRHEALRTAFPGRDGQPVQLLLDPAPVALPLVDFAALAPARRETAALAAAAELARLPFDLAAGRLLRPALLRLAAEDHVLLLTQHHIVSDGWSVGVLLRELGALYGAFSHGRPSPLPELPVQYADFAVWQRRWQTDAALDRQLAYWCNALAEAPAALPLPYDRPRPKVASFTGAKRRHVLPPSLSREVRDLCRRQQVTLFMASLAAFQALLCRASGQRDLLVGSPIAGRSRSELEGLIGFFANVLVLRAQIDPAAPFDQLLAQVRQRTLDAYEHQDLPFDRLLDELGVERDLSRAPLFQVYFVLQNAPAPPAGLEELAVRFLDLPLGVARVDWTVALVEAGDDRLELLSEHDTRLFDATTVERLLGHLTRLMAAAAVEPERRVDDLPLLAPGERHQLLGEWSAAADPPSLAEPPVPLPCLFAAQVADRPDAAALVDGDAWWSYAGLDAAAGRLAALLRDAGVGPEVPVALRLERSAAQVVAILGVLQAGGAYVPIEPDAPAERRARILADAWDDAEPALLVTHERLTSEDAGAPAVRAVAIEGSMRPGAVAATQPRAPHRDVRLDGDHLAYLLFTSGSTGQPKGVAVTHANVSRLLTATARRYAFAPADVWTLFHSYAFDFSVWEIWGALALGGRLVVVPRLVGRSPGEMSRLLARQRVTVLNQTPSAFRQLAPAIIADGGAAARALRAVIFGGEALELPALAPWLERFGDARPRLVNMYGITETTVHVTHRDVRRQDLARADRSPVGRAIDDLELLLLDARLNPVPIGVAGEILVGGPGLARGYRRRPGWTAERFLPHPAATAPGARLYRSGDLARRTADGGLDFLGRIDHQVKVRGFRIELGEVEAALAAHPEVRDAVVLMRDDGAGSRLVGYAVADAAGRAADVRRFVQERLPEYMVPAAVVVIDAWPLTSQGKLDRRALPAPAFERAGDHEPVAPRTPVEEALAEIWAEVLGVPEVHVQDDFFDLGGHSLLATQVVSRARAVLRIELPVRALFEAPTLAALAQRCADALDAPGATPREPLQAAPRDGALPLSFAQQRLWLLARLTPEDPSYNVPLALRIDGPVDAAALGAALTAVVRRHEVLRTTILAVGGEPVQQIAAPSAVPLPEIELGRLPAEVAEQRAWSLARADARRRFSLERGPLLRAALLHLAPRRHLLLLTLHHVAADEGSARILYRELAELYRAARQGTPATLPPLPVQYADYARWQRRLLQGGELAAQVGYWRDQLAGAPPVLELPLDRPRPLVRTVTGGRIRRRMPHDLGEGLRRLGRSAGATLFMTALAAFKTLLCRLTGERDLVVGTPVAQRHQREIEPLVGFFVNTLVLRTRLTAESAAPTFLDAVDRVRTAALEAYGRQDLPFEQLVEELAPERSLSATPLFQVMFSLREGALLRRSVEDATWTAAGLDPGTAKFDLTLFVEHHAGELRAVWEYNADLFDRTTVARWASHLETLAASAVDAPEQSVLALALLTPAQRGQLLREWSATPAPAGELGPVHEVVAGRAVDWPDAVAVVAGDERLTFAALIRRARRLARHLRTLGAGPEVPVGVLLERSARLPVAILGVLEAGAAFVPLSPEHPPRRLAFLIDDARLPLVITQTSLAPRLPATAARIVDLDAPEVWSDASAAASAAPAGATPDTLAYVLYTSGSTGQPKGTLIPHRGLSNYLRWCEAAYPLAPGNGAPVATPLSFDLTLTSLLAPLVAGRPVTLLPEVHALEALAAAWRQTPASWSLVKLTPAHLELLTRELGAGELAGRAHALVLGGEALRWESLTAWQRHAPHTRLINEYGPTETVVGCATFTVPPAAAPSSPTADAPASGPVPIGRPIHGARLYVLGNDLGLVPPGSAGELGVAGGGLARGYLGRPALTAARFVPEPHDAPGARLYRTGDRVRQRGDGVLEFLGRIDQQIKLRGYRIEPGEIEAALRDQPGVREAVVTVRDDLPAGSGLVAYWTASGEAAPEAEVLAATLRRDLPAYMVPAAFVALTELPLNRHGKVDRQALPAPSAPAPAATIAVTEPQGDLAAVIAATVREVLRLPHVTPDDNFFDLGAHSMTLVQIHERLAGREDAAGLTVIDLFRFPTVRSLSEYLTSRSSERPAAGAGDRTEQRTREQDRRLERRRRRQALRG